jgi:crossover junction endodeoxyribonuclease RuvC
VDRRKSEAAASNCRLVLGIDPGTAITGYGLVAQEGDALRLVECGTVQTSPRSPLPERLRVLHTGLMDVLARWHPSEAAVEELFFSRNARMALAVGHARGVALLALAQSDVAVAEYTPMQVKQAIVSYGKGSKRQVQEMVRLLLGLDAVPEPDDAADAVALAICHLNSSRLSRLLDLSET